MQIVYEGYPLQKDLDWVHARLGAPELNKRSCACYLKEVGNAPEPGTNVAWAESSAVNYGNSVLGIRTNRNGAGIDMICALTAKAPYFGLMTDEGRQAKWLIDVKTSKTPDWGVLGTAIGRKVVEDVPLVYWHRPVLRGRRGHRGQPAPLEGHGQRQRRFRLGRSLPRRGLDPGGQGRRAASCSSKAIRPTSTTTPRSRGSSRPSATCGRRRTGIPPAPSSAARTTPSSK